MVDRLTNLVAIFENPALDFSKNRAEGDDILVDANSSGMSFPFHVTIRARCGIAAIVALGSRDGAVAVSGPRRGGIPPKSRQNGEKQAYHNCYLPW
jgi:hypothetical protein